MIRYPINFILQIIKGVFNLLNTLCTYMSKSRYYRDQIVNRKSQIVHCPSLII
jgi:hypothetical protein